MRCQQKKVLLGEFSLSNMCCVDNSLQNLTNVFDCLASIQYPLVEPAPVAVAAIALLHDDGSLAGSASNVLLFYSISFLIIGNAKLYRILQ